MSRRSFPWGPAVLLLVASLVACRPSTVTAKRPATGASGLPSDTLQAAATDFSGVVVDQSGRVAAGVAVKCYLVSNDAAALVANDSAALVSPSGAGRRVTETGAGGVTAVGEVLTDDLGRFRLPVTQKGARYTLLAERNAVTKAILLAQPVTSGISLKLAPTGTLSGRVRSISPVVRDFLGTTVFLPGTTFLAATAEDGSFSIGNVPEGLYRLVAIHPDMGRAVSERLAVLPGETTSVTGMVLDTPVPEIRNLSPNPAVIGERVQVTGLSFGASRGARAEVLINGVVAPGLELADESMAFVVPLGAGSGEVAARIGSLTGPTRRLDIIDALRLEMARPVSSTATWSHVGPWPLAVGATRSIVFQGSSRGGTFATIQTGPAGIQILPDSGAASLVGGLVQGQVAGTVRFRARRGELDAVASIDVVPPIATVERLPGASPVLAPLPVAEATPLPGLAVATRLKPVARHVDGSLYEGPWSWEVLSGPIRVDGTGRVEAMVGLYDTTARVRARPLADPDRAVDLTVEVRSQGELAVEIQ
ncbi:MAG: hypothetical protein VKP57_08820 [Candidatus Sericytochromatia bacterium]|nr:hypothetical protein [Candidatus Sericytochromatia bacterium]